MCYFSQIVPSPRIRYGNVGADPSTVSVTSVSWVQLSFSFLGRASVVVFHRLASEAENQRH